jgi:5-methylcytosine-specific restriction enzyme subunit McrC
VSETLIELREYQPRLLTPDELSNEDGKELWKRFDAQVAVEFPSPKTEGLWKLTSQGWVGLLPLTRDLRFMLLPRIPLQNLFAMWEYAYRLRQFKLPEGLVSSGSVEGFYSQLAGVLAKRVLLRLRKGIYKTYRPETDELVYIRGSLDLRERLRFPWKPSVVCDFENTLPTSWTTR